MDNIYFFKIIFCTQEQEDDGKNIKVDLLENVGEKKNRAK